MFEKQQSHATPHPTASQPPLSKMRNPTKRASKEAEKCASLKTVGPYCRRSLTFAVYADLPLLLAPRLPDRDVEQGERRGVVTCKTSAKCIPGPGMGSRSWTESELQARAGSQFLCPGRDPYHSVVKKAKTTVFHTYVFGGRDLGSWARSAGVAGVGRGRWSSLVAASKEKPKPNICIGAKARPHR